MSTRPWDVRSGGKHTEQLVVISVDSSVNPIGIGVDGPVWISVEDVAADTVGASSFEDFIVDLIFNGIRKR